MSNSEWYASLESAQPWKAFNGYFQAVNALIADLEAGRRTVGAETSTSAKSPATGKPARTAAVPEPVLDLTAIAAVAAEAGRLYDALPPKAKSQSHHCYGLPRSYPKDWMKRPKSNSLMLEFRTVQNMPSNGLKSWKE